MDSERAAGGRAAVAHVLLAGEWPWPRALREDEAFVDGLHAFVDACDAGGVSDVVLAAALAGEGAELSAVARIVLLVRATRVADKTGRRNVEPVLLDVRPAPLEAEGGRAEVDTLAQALGVAVARGAGAVVVARWIKSVLGERVRGMPVIAHGDAPPDATTLHIVFEEGVSLPAGSRCAAQAFGSEIDSDDARGRGEVVVRAPAHAALAAWFAAESRDGVTLRGSAAPPDSAWSWPVPEAARPLVAPPMPFSASRLNGFVKCPRRWFYEYLCDALEDEGSAAATYGKVFHEALEALHRDVRAPAEYSGNALLERLHFELDRAFERNEAEFASRLDTEVSRLKARAVAAHYARWLRAEAADHPMRVEAVEALQRWSMGGHEFVGYIDRIDQPEGGGPITIYDYKTGRIDDDPREYVAKMRRGDEAQLALYYTVRRLRGDEVGRLALISLRDPRDPVWVLALDMVDDTGNAVVERTPRDGVIRGAATPADMQAAVDALVARADELTTRGFEHFNPGDDPPCSFCTYARACREQPPDAERIFAR